MVQVSIRELRHKAGEIVDRVASGEQVTITRDGKAVAEMRSAPRGPLSADALLRRARALPAVDPRRLRRDIDALLDTSLSDKVLGLSGGLEVIAVPHPDGPDA